MKTSDIKQILLDRGYDSRAAQILSEDLSKIQSELIPCRELWLDKGIEGDYEANGISINAIRRKFNLKYPAALLSINWVIKDPKTAIPTINYGLR